MDGNQQSNLTKSQNKPTNKEHDESKKIKMLQQPTINQMDIEMDISNF